MQDSTIAAIATAPGAGGIAVVRLSGPESYAVAARVFRPANPDRTVAGAKGYTALYKIRVGSITSTRPAYMVPYCAALC